MIEIASSVPSHTTFVAAFGAAMLAGQLQYPSRVEAYEVQQVSGTYSNFIDSLARSSGVNQFAEQLAAMYKHFADHQERLGAEFEAAIFSDLESLYEA